MVKSLKEVEEEAKKDPRIGGIMIKRDKIVKLDGGFPVKKITGDK